MIDPIKLMRGVFLALVLQFAAPLLGLGGLFLGVQAAQAQQSPAVASVLFEGNLRFTDANLVAMIDVMNTGIADPAVIARDVQTIRTAYINAGYTDASVTTRIEPVGDGRVRVVFVVNEGVKAGIAAINFTGNNSIGAWQLKSILKTHETSWLSWLLKDDNYTQAQLDVDRELIRRYYVDNGFPDAQVPSAVAEFSAERAAYFVTFTIVEGERYTFGEIGVETSISGLDGSALTGVIRTHRGETFSASRMQQTADDMAIEATNLGYPFAEVRPRIDRDAASGVFNVTYLVDEGQRIYVDRIDITGNDKTRDFVIRRELDFAEGDPFNRSLLARGKSKIEALGFFSVVEVSLAPGSAPDKVNIAINVVEQSSGDYGATIGYASDQGILGTLSLTERNFLGRGQYLKASISASQTGQSFDFSFTEPHFAGLDMSAGIDVYHKITDESDTSRYGKTATGGQLRFGLPVTRDLSASIFTGVDSTTLMDNDSPYTSLFCVGAGCADGLSFTKAWVGYGLTYNSVDSVSNPTSGLYATLTQQYVGGDYNFLKTEAKARYFMPIWADAGVVGSLKGQVGIINDFSGDGVSPLESFGYGGTLVRGFTAGSVGPRIGGEALGYTAYAGLQAEVQFPLPMIPDTWGLGGAVWADAAYIDGAGGNPSLVYDPGSTAPALKSSAGASIIWNSPFGPLRGDAAYKLSGASTDGFQTLSLTLNNLL